jgi:hypothetical protein
MTQARQQRSTRRARPAPLKWTWFCGYCGNPHDKEEPPQPLARVCGKCGFGLLIEAPGPVAPDPREAFLVVDHELRVQAVGRRAEDLLNVRENFVVGTELTELLLPIDSEKTGGGTLTDAVFAAASDEHMPVPVHLALRGVHDPNLVIRARIGRCGPAPAALLVLERRGRASRSAEPHGRISV